MNTENQNDGPDQRAETSNGLSIIARIRDIIPNHLEEGSWFGLGLDAESEYLVTLYYGGFRPGEAASDVPTEQRQAIIDSVIWAICGWNLSQLHAIAAGGGNIDPLDVDACFAFSRAAYEKAEADRKNPIINMLAE